MSACEGWEEEMRCCRGEETGRLCILFQDWRVESKEGGAMEWVRFDFCFERRG